MSIENPFAFPDSHHSKGMALRDWFAGNCASVVAGKLLDVGYDADRVAKTVAESAYEIADALLVVRSKPKGTQDSRLSEAQMEHMAQRFLGWPLPDNFCPDAGISFKPTFNDEYNARHGNPPQYHRPSGTNLLCYTQALDMVRHIVEGLPG